MGLRDSEKNTSDQKYHTKVGKSPFEKEIIVTSKLRNLRSFDPKLFPNNSKSSMIHDVYVGTA